MSTDKAGKGVMANSYEFLDGRKEAFELISQARSRAHEKAAILLAERECPEDLVSWGKTHRIPEFAKFTWQAGFLAGMRAAMLDADADDAKAAP